MDSRRFSEAYPMLPDKTPPSHPERRELLTAPRHWMRFFNNALSDHLADRPAQPREEFYNAIHEYYPWTALELPRSQSKLYTLHNPSEGGHVDSELNFHLINGPLVQLWDTVLYDAPVSTDELTEMQQHLAINFAPIVRQRRLLAKQATNPATDYRVKSFTGLLTEVDAMTTFLEFMKEHREVTIVPAPHQFEANRLATEGTVSKNSDFIAIDNEKRQARGIQVKTGIMGMRLYQHYDPEFVTLIEGTSDFGNNIFRNRKLNTEPGLLTLGVLAEMPLSHKPLTHHHADYMRSRAIAKEITRGIRPYLPTAVQHIGKRILHDLYKPVAEISDKPVAS